MAFLRCSMAKLLFPHIKAAAAGALSSSLIPGLRWWCPLQLVEKISSLQVSVSWALLKPYCLHNDSIVEEPACTSCIRFAQSRSMTRLSEGMQKPLKSEGGRLVSLEASVEGNTDKLSKTASKHGYERKRKGPSGSGTRAKSLVTLVKPLSNVKEDIYRALDAWAAFEPEFPVVAVRKALQRLKQQEQWQRIIQVCKWMLSKGQGQTLGTYNLMLKAYDMDARLEDAEALWKKLLALHTRSMPRIMFVHMISIYRRRDMPEKILEVFKQMRKVGVKPDGGTLKRVGEVYKQLGMPEKQVELFKKYPLPTWKYYHSKGKTMRVTASGAMDSRTEDSMDVFQRVQPKVNVNDENPDISDSGDPGRRADSKINVDSNDSDIPGSVDNSGRANLEINIDKKKSDHEDFIKEIIATM